MRHSALASFQSAPASIRGFTLIEMLVVMLIMGLFVGLISAIAKPDDRSRVQLEAERLAQLLNLVAAESRLTGKPMRWTSDGPGYRFWRQQEQGWVEVNDSALFRPRTLPDGMSIADFRVEALSRPDAMRLEFLPYGLPMTYSLEIALGTHRTAIAATPYGEARPRHGSGNPDVTAQQQ